MTDFLGQRARVWINSWRDATLEAVRDELAAALRLSFEPRDGAYVCATPAGELRLDARPARTCPQQIFILKTAPPAEDEDTPEDVSRALAAELRGLGHDWYVPYEHEAAWWNGELDRVFFNMEMFSDVLTPRWLAWVGEDEHEEATYVVVAIDRAWHEGASNKDKEYVWRRWAALDTEWCRVAPSERLRTLRAFKAVEELAVIGPELDEIEAVLQAGRAARPGTKESLAELREKVAANPEPAAVPLLARIDALLARLQSATTVMIIAIPAKTLDDFESISLSDRPRESSGWTNYPVRSARRLSAFWSAATKLELGAWLAEDRDGELDEPVETHVIDQATVAEVLPRLDAAIANAEATAAALCAHGGGTADVARVTAALTTEAWPTSGDPAEEAAAFAYELRDYLQIAQREEIGVCWEFRGPLEPRPPVAMSVTILQVPTEGHDEFEALMLDERRRKGGGWATFPMRSGRRLCTFAMKATGEDFGVLGCRDERGKDGENVDTNLIADVDLEEVLPLLEARFITHADRTIAQLLAHDDDRTTSAKIAAALETGAWPTSGDPAEETAAFAHHLMAAMRAAKEKKLGVCWEYRGDVVV